MNNTPNSSVIPPPKFSLVQQIAAWSVHAFTASGSIFALLCIIAIAANDWRMVGLYIVICQFIDGIDGAFARLFQVKKVLPFFDGKTVDYVIDFSTYAIIPAYFLYEAALLPPEVRWFTVICVLMISSYYYGKSGMVSDDMHFVGFPVLWNVVVFYLFFVVHLSPWTNFALIMLLCVLHVIPTKYLYPSRTKKLQWLNIAISFGGILLSGIIAYLYPNENIWLRILALAVIVYLLAMSFYNTFVEKTNKTTK